MERVGFRLQCAWAYPELMQVRRYKLHREPVQTASQLVPGCSEQRV